MSFGCSAIGCKRQMIRMTLRIVFGLVGFGSCGKFTSQKFSVLFCTTFGCTSCGQKGWVMGRNRIVMWSFFVSVVGFYLGLLSWALHAIKSEVSAHSGIEKFEDSGFDDCSVRKGKRMYSPLHHPRELWPY